MRSPSPLVTRSPPMGSQARSGCPGDRSPRVLAPSVPEYRGRYSRADYLERAYTLEEIDGAGRPGGTWTEIQLAEAVGIGRVGVEDRGPVAVVVLHHDHQASPRERRVMGQI